MIAPNQFFSDAPEKAFEVEADHARIRQLGQFFTPYHIAQFMARWVVAGKPKTVLDPAVGLGVLLRAVREQSEAKTLIGYDVDPVVLKKAKNVWRGQRVTLTQHDYLVDGWEQRYDGIICNPPYLHFRHYENRTGLLAEFRERLGIPLGGQTNLHTLFLLKSLHQLSELGRAAYILPPEFLNADYGEAVKQYLLAHKNLKQVIAFDVKENVFDNVLTTSCILLFDRATESAGVTFRAVKSLEELVKPGGSGKQVAYGALDPTVKWRTYYQTQKRQVYRNLVPLATYGAVRRGIATGANSFFTFNEEKQREFGIADQYLLPCLTKANQANSHFFTQKDWARLKAAGKNVYLLNIGPQVGAAAKRYIRWGEEQGTDQRYLTSHRKPWYRIEERPPAPILVTVFNRNGIRFVRNEAGVRNLTCFHGLYLNALGLAKIDLLMAYLMTPVAREIFEEHGRAYGEGLEKFEPNDLNGALMLDLSAVTAPRQKEIGELYKAYRAESDETLLVALNEIFSEWLRR
jgi:adenine-specific DNA-methyltransferase